MRSTRSTTSPGASRRTETVAGDDAPAAAPVAVLVVDDQATFRRALRDLLAAMPGFEPVGEAASGAEALELAARLGPDLILLDVRMPQMDGLETARRLHERGHDAVIVLISLEVAVAHPETVGAAAHLHKRDLSKAALREIWAAHGVG